MHNQRMDYNPFRLRWNPRCPTVHLAGAEEVDGGLLYMSARAILEVLCVLETKHRILFPTIKHYRYSSL